MTWPLFDSSLADGFRVGAAVRILLNDGLSQLRIFCPATPADSTDPGTKISDRRALSAGRPGLQTIDPLFRVPADRDRELSARGLLKSGLG